MVRADLRTGQVLFICRPALGTKAVFLVGTFNDWSPKSHRMRKLRDGTFRRRLTIAPGQYQYKFVVDGTWTVDPDLADRMRSAQGARNAVWVRLPVRRQAQNPLPA